MILSPDRKALFNNLEGMWIVNPGDSLLQLTLGDTNYCAEMQDDGIRLKFYQPQAAVLANCYNVAKQEQIGN